MRCYKLEDHNARECLKGTEYKICSECSDESHLWYECKGRVEKCINCNEEHSTLAIKYPERKIILIEKRKDDIERQKMTDSDISKIQTNISS